MFNIEQYDFEVMSKASMLCRYEKIINNQQPVSMTGMASNLYIIRVPKLTNKLTNVYQVFIDYAYPEYIHAHS